MVMCSTPHYKLQLINGPLTSHLFKAFIQSSVKSSNAASLCVKHHLTHLQRRQAKPSSKPPGKTLGTWQWQPIGFWSRPNFPMNRLVEPLMSPSINSQVLLQIFLFGLSPGDAGWTISRHTSNIPITGFSPLTQVPMNPISQTTQSRVSIHILFYLNGFNCLIT